MTVYSPLTWGIYTEPPPDIPECGFVGELCPTPIRGKSSFVSGDDVTDVSPTSSNEIYDELCDT